MCSVIFTEYLVSRYTCKKGKDATAPSLEGLIYLYFFKLQAPPYKNLSGIQFPGTATL